MDRINYNLQFLIELIPTILLSLLSIFKLTTESNNLGIKELTEYISLVAENS